MALARWSYQLIIFSLFPLAQAYTTFQTNCSTPATFTNYHPNLPEQGEADDHASGPEKRRGNTNCGMKVFYRSTLRMLWTSIAPEVLVVAACTELIRARSLCKRMKELDLAEDETWSLTHSYYANMGGFVVRNLSADKTIYHDPYHLTGEDIFELRRRGDMAKLPGITEAEIKDKSQGDIQIIARFVKKLHVSPLEVAVVAFALCAVFSYVLYWEKPQRVGVAQTIQLNDNTYLYSKGKLKQSPRFFRGILDMILDCFDCFKVSHKKNLLRGMPISMDSSISDKRTRGTSDTIALLVIVSGSAALSGGLHTIAWNFPFPTTIEVALWRCASIYTAAAPFFAILLSFRVATLPATDIVKRYVAPFVIILLGYLMVLYSVARLFIIVEMFRMLLFLPPGSFISTWASSVPHVA
ncbi:hypothetical protein ACQKWADRAFT_326357 [Trichoderma austrokoningii]